MIYKIYMIYIISVIYNIYCIYNIYYLLYITYNKFIIDLPGFAIDQIVAEIWPIKVLAWFHSTQHNPTPVMSQQIDGVSSELVYVSGKLYLILIYI